MHAGSQWRHLANTIEPSMCGGDATFLLSNYFDHFPARYVLHASRGKNKEKYNGLPYYIGRP